MQKILANLEAGLEALAEALDQGQVTLDKKGVHLKALEAEGQSLLVENTREALFKAVGNVQLSELIVTVDSETGSAGPCWSVSRST